MVASPDSSTQHLPAVAPDLLLVRWGGHGEWQVRNLSERLSQLLGIGSTSVRGRSLHHLFPAAVPPSLPDLAAEVLDHGQDLSEIKLRLVPDGGDEFSADLQFAGLTEDYLGQLVRIVLRRETVASKQELGFRNLIGISRLCARFFAKSACTRLQMLL